MIKLTGETKELKQIYTFNNHASYAFEFANNLGYKHGGSTWNDDYFTPYLNKLVNDGILIKMYDVFENGFREAVYSFKDGSHIELLGENHMNMRLYYHH